VNRNFNTRWTLRVFAVVKWLAVAGWLIGGVVEVLSIANAQSWPVWTLWLEPVAGVVAVAAAAFTWAVVTWLQEVLRALTR
jgi:hypothetical protein